MPPPSMERGSHEFVSSAFLALTAICVVANAYSVLQHSESKRKSKSGLVSESSVVDAQLNRIQSKLSSFWKATASQHMKDMPGSGSNDEGNKSAQVLLGLKGTNLAEVVAQCKQEVERIVKECKADNRKFRDREFDLEFDKELCLFALNAKRRERFKPEEVQRLSDLFDVPTLFNSKRGEASPADVHQGALGDCWFLSAISALAGKQGLLSSLCAARDENVGVYGFIFCDSGKWTYVVVDDLLYSELPVYDRLSPRERLICKKDRDAYRTTARKGGDGLTFARSGKEGEAWVPLLEKAFAKLHGSYEALWGGYASKGFEALTGGFTESWTIPDILDTDKFWTDELSKSGTDRFFDVCAPDVGTTRNANPGFQTKEGIVHNHAYPVIRALEINARRFLVIRNPWGTEAFKWKGKWGDTSKEWTDSSVPLKVRVEILKGLEHEFGAGGAFVMEYSDFLDHWHYIERTLIFDSKWMTEQIWVNIPPKPEGYPWQFGEIIFYFTLSQSSPVHINLSIADDTSFDNISGRAWFFIDFYVCKRGERHWRTTSTCFREHQPNVGCSIESLEEGEYVVYPRIKRKYYSTCLGYFKEGKETKKWDERKLSRTMTRRAQCLSMASNADHQALEKYIPTTVADLHQPPSDDDDSNSEAEACQPCSSCQGRLGTCFTHNPPQQSTSDPEDSEPPSPPPQTTNTASGKDEEKKVPHVRLFELCKEEEDREMLNVGLRIYAKDECLASLSGLIPGVGQGSWIPEDGWPVAEV